MRLANRHHLGMGFAALVLLGLVQPPCVRAEECLATDGFRAPYLLVGKSANDDDHYGLFNESQGITNGHPEMGHPYWYISRNDEDTRTTYIYKVRYSEHLKNNFTYWERTIRMPDGFGGVCDHIGGIDYHVHDGEAYIVASYDGCQTENDRSLIVFFRADDIYGIDDLLYPVASLDISDIQVNDCPWVSVRSDGRLYSSRGGVADPRDPYSIFEYTIDWDDVSDGQDPVYQSREITLRDSNFAHLWLKERQGADFSSDGQLFFFNAYGSDDDGRVFVFDTSESLYPNHWDLVKKSSVSDMPFYLEDDPFVFKDDELEGISYYDMNCVDGYHSGMPRSELHSMVLHNDWPGDDELTIHHFTSLIHTEPESGVQAPFYEWWGGHGAWDGASLVLEPGTYEDGAAVLSGKKVLFLAPDGPALIR